MYTASGTDRIRGYFAISAPERRWVIGHEVAAAAHGILEMIYSKLILKSLRDVLPPYQKRVTQRGQTCLEK
jgi:hypothetical protein